MSELTSLKIERLHGYKTYDLRFEDNILITVGENGAGKTAVLRILHYPLSVQWSVLAKFGFDSMTAVANRKKYVIKNSDLVAAFDLSDKDILMHFPSSVRGRLLEMAENHNTNEIPLSELKVLCNRYDIPLHMIIRKPNYFDGSGIKKINKEVNQEYQEIKKSLSDIQILYLPTYRRIRQELNTVFRGIDDDDLRHKEHFMHSRDKCSSTELVGSGMKSMEYSIKSMLSGPRELTGESLNSLTLGYLRGVVEKKYSEVDLSQIESASDETTKNILGRIEKKILSDNSKVHLFDVIGKARTGGEINEHAKAICHYFIKLLNFQQELEAKELNVAQFCEVCSNYMEDKTFEYTSLSFSLSVVSVSTEEDKYFIALDQLSSGEKQIVSLFSQLYPMEKNSYLVLIDEPKLSLPIPWQRKFLMNVKNGGFCADLVAIIHSLSIYDNELGKYAHGLGEFLEE